MENELMDKIKRNERTNRASTRVSTRTLGRSYSKNKSKKSRYPSRNRNLVEPNLKQELLFIRASVSFIIVVFAFALAKFDTPKTNEIREKLKIAITESVSFAEAKELGEKGVEMIYTFKEQQTEKIDSMIEEEILLPNDSQTIN